jgi:hypothetical protein
VIFRHRIEEEMEQKLINDENRKFQGWAHGANQQFLKDAARVEHLYRGWTE